ncbi:hypothetical protein M8C21_027747 [Ambrosia artemisiifolia]|uniref:Uncharacterized protein n=1 Tax=Ambrosia artemisiifolia TaxID=4212 RepID=A0AAD5C3N4_AMBAR|nr:hypothetical protein M8C21_027747 [Ambrosia artemisiifolia]
MNSHLRQFGRFPDFSDRILYLTDGIRHVCRTVYNFVRSSKLWWCRLPRKAVIPFSIGVNKLRKRKNRVRTMNGSVSPRSETNGSKLLASSSSLER